MAILINSCNAIIYEIPKTGTTWIRSALTDCGISWSNARLAENSCQRHSPPFCYEKADGLSCCAVRHPLSWYESYYRANCHDSIRLRKRIRPHEYKDGVWYSFSVFGINITEEFGDWVSGVLERNPACLTRMCESFAGPFGFSAIDVVMKQESLASDLCDFLDRCGVDFYRDRIMSHPQKNKAPSCRVKIEKETEDLILRNEKPLIERWYNES